MWNQFLTIFAKSKGDNYALTEAIRVKLVNAHSLLKINLFAKYQENQVETEGKGKQTIIFGQILESPRAITPQWSILPGWKLRLAHLLFLINTCAKYQVNQIETEVYTKLIQLSNSDSYTSPYFRLKKEV